jgi:farnesyl-diphosphate farnesyltransferase
MSKPSVMAASSPVRLNRLLKEVSRSFYLTMRILPGAIRPQIGLAYLLARTSDTIADTEIVPVRRRLQALQSLRERILGVCQAPLDLGELAQHQRAPSERRVLAHCESALHDIEHEKPTDPQKVRCHGSSAERILLERIDDILALLNRCSALDQRLIRETLTTITSGQELDLKRFAAAQADHIIALQSEQELDDYTYRVAGCVGEFWTKMCRTHLFPRAVLDDALLLANGIRFGQGLQLVNILRDLPADLRQGRCYLPAGQLSAGGLSPADLLEPANEDKLRPLYEQWLGRTEAHLAAGWDYTNALPRRCVRVRLACAWPILIGIKTVAKLRIKNVLDGRQRIKISRAEVRQIMARSILCYPWPSSWRRLFSQTALA